VKPTVDTEMDSDRRAFLKDCGRYAAITPPAVTFLLSTSMSSKAIAASSGRGAAGNAKGHWKGGGGTEKGKGHAYGRTKDK